MAGAEVNVTSDVIRITSIGYRRGMSGNRRTSGRVGLPLQRDLDLSSSGYSQRERRAPPLRVNSEAESGAVVLLGEETAGGEERAATCCQLCGSAFSTIRLPLLLFCGHSYCEACIQTSTRQLSSVACAPSSHHSASRVPTASQGTSLSWT